MKKIVAISLLVVFTALVYSTSVFSAPPPPNYGKNAARFLSETPTVVKALRAAEELFGIESPWTSKNSSWKAYEYGFVAPLKGKSDYSGFNVHIYWNGTYEVQKNNRVVEAGTWEELLSRVNQ